MIEFNCPHCKRSLKCDDLYAGKQAQCIYCKQGIVVPVPVQPASPPAAALVPMDNKPEPQPAPAAAPAPVQNLDRQMLRSLIHNIVVMILLGAAQMFIEYLPGTDISLGRLTLGGWIGIGIAAAIVVLMILIARPLGEVSSYYIGLIFRVQGALADNPELQARVHSATIYFVLLAYLAVFYWTVLSSFLTLMVVSFDFPANLMKLVKLSCAILGIVLVIAFVRAVRPLAAHFTDKVTDRTMAATQKLDSKACVSCGSQIPLASKFCPSCGKPT